MLLYNYVYTSMYDASYINERCKVMQLCIGTSSSLETFAFLYFLSLILLLSSVFHRKNPFPSNSLIWMGGVVLPSIIYFVKKLKIIILLLLSLCDSAQLFSQKKGVI
jgi:hypothetical protein